MIELKSGYLLVQRTFLSLKLEPKGGMSHPHFSSVSPDGSA